MNRRPTVRVTAGVVLAGALLSGAGPLWADGLVAVAPAHGPMLMLYISQPLGSAGATRVFGLRLDQIAQTAQGPAANAAAEFYAASPQRSLVDLQIRRRADVRIQFDHRLTWNMNRREFELPSSRPAKPIDFLARTH